MQQIIKLTPPLISAEHIKEKITCIRAHRERIFYVSTQLHNNKLICHNYGHGGAGWTFLFGSVTESIRQFEAQLELHEQFENKPITIIGAGCYGLLTAITLARKGYTVNIVAADTENIPSNKAAGFFFPRHRKCSNPQEIEVFKTTGIESYQSYLSIINGTHSFIKSGPKLLPGYFGLDIDPGFAPYIEHGLIDAPKRVTIDFGNGKTYQAMEYKTLFINSSAIMQELYRNIQELGIIIEKKHITSFDEIAQSIIFNCAGLGAKNLTHDKKIVPVQGHLIILKDQPDMHALQYMINMKVTMTNSDGKKRDELIYYAPKESGILGVTFIRGQDSLTANQHEFDRLLQRCHDYFGT
ncbi:MAG: FAD-dependent oxidoreductase [Candidatus Babeliales bacterium]|nr:FAD-dependent oxidoreductase [Candidatus Babeliales bacterium]